ncbi:MAG: phytanoyl-CoA dioxygenase family protein [Pyrinomonadaceae bacterium]
MKRFKDSNLQSADAREQNVRLASVDALVSELETNGVVLLPSLLNAEQLRGLQSAFNARLKRLRWNQFDGYQRTEPYRLMIEDVLLLDQGFVDLALHPLVKGILGRYLGPAYELTEAKGWKSLPTRRDFHGWHGDMWYDQTVEKKIHREIKLALYLTDVRSGAFNVIRGTHQQQHPHNLKRAEIRELPMSDRVELAGPAGTAFLFDTTVVHRQGIPMLEPRQAIFYAYHDPGVALQEEDIYYNRYHPLFLNAAFLGNLSEEDQRILGFGNKTNFQPAFARHENPPLVYRAYCASLTASLRLEQFREQMAARWRRALKIKPNTRY